MFWKISDYVTVDGVNEVQDWLSVQEADVRPFLKNALFILENRPNWGLPLVRFMEREHEGLVAIRLTMEERRSRPKRKYRPVGFIRSAGLLNEFVFLTGCLKLEQGRLLPPGTFDHALDLKRDCEQLKGGTDEHQH